MQLLPLAAVFIAGVAVRHFGLLNERHSSLLLRLVFYLGLPVVIFLAIIKIHLDGTLIWLAVFPPLVISLTIIVSLVLRRSTLRKVKPKTFAAMLAGAAIMNQSFLIPFVDARYGADGLARLAIIDSFNAIMIFSLLYAVIAMLGHNRPKPGIVAAKVFSAPTLWALVLGIVIKLANISIPTVAVSLFEPIALLVSLTLLFALGIKFRPRLKKPRLFAVEVGLRFVLGAAIGLCFVKLFHLHGLDAQIILIASTAPIGLNSISLSEVQKLDIDFAVSSVSGGLLIGLGVTPLVIHFVQTINW